MRLQSPPEIGRTLVQLGRDCIFSGIWRGIRPGSWRFTVGDFSLGDLNALRHYCLELNEGRIERADRFVVVESQGDGRVVRGPALLSERFGRETFLTLAVGPQEPRREVGRIGGNLPIDSRGDLVVKDGTIGFISGREAGLQSVFVALSIRPGELFYHRQAGSYFSRYYWMFRENPTMLAAMLKLEIARLATVPLYEDRPPPERHVSLDFVRRVLDTSIIDPEMSNNRIKASVTIEFTDGSTATLESAIFIHSPDTADPSGAT